MRSPNFLGVGTQKGGTTYLHNLLKCHPQIFLAYPKEIHFFSLHWQKGKDWYFSHFNDATDNQVCGEITPYYLYHPEAPQRICSLLPAVKNIILLRDPVERALSQYFHSKRLGFETLELKDAIAAEPERLRESGESLARGQKHLAHQQHSYLSRSRYEEQVRRFEQRFPAQQLLILRSEDLFQTPQLIWDQVINFLELDPMICPDLPPAYAGCGGSLLVDDAVKNQLRQKLEATYCWMNEVVG